MTVFTAFVTGPRYGEGMAADTDYTGTHQVFLPKDYLNSVDAAIGLYQEDIAAVAANLDVEGLKTSPTRRLIRGSLAGCALWLAPAIWITCS